MKITKKAAAAVVASTAALAGAGVAFAFWTSTGTGNGSAQSLTAVSITVSAGAGAADLYPGFTAGDAYFTLTNTNPYPVTFTSMSPGTVTSGDPTNCPASNVTVISRSGLALTVAGNTTSPTLSVADVVTMVAAAPEGCQGVSFSVVVTMTGTQSAP